MSYHECGCNIMYKVNCTVIYERIPNNIQVKCVYIKRRGGYSPTQLSLSRVQYPTFALLDAGVRKMLKNNNMYADKWSTQTGYWSDIDYIDVTYGIADINQLHINANGVDCI